jgi:hypothetical protein
MYDELDTNGVSQDHVETFWPPDTRSWANTSNVRGNL